MKIQIKFAGLTKTTILLFLLISFLINFKLNAQTSGVNRWFVDKNASGSNNGLSWANAWTSFSAINWTSLGANDTLFISGGTDSTVYTETLNVQASGNANGLLVIRPGLSTGHNGKVVIQNGNPNLLYIYNRQYIRVEKITFRATWGVMGNGFALYLKGTYSNGVNVIYLDSLTVISESGTPTGSGGEYQFLTSYSGWPTLGNVDSVFTRHGYFLNRRSPAVRTENDGIQMQYVTNSVTEGNTVIIDNNYPSDQSSPSHNDCYTIANTASNVTVRNNIFINAQTSTNQNSQGTIVIGLVGYFAYYNNVISTPNFTGWTSTFSIYDGNPNCQYYIYGNTFQGGANNFIVRIQTGYNQNVYFMNNIIDATLSPTYNTTRITWANTSPIWSQINGNLYGTLVDYNNVLMSNYTMAQLNALGAETIGVSANRWNVNPLFINSTANDYTLQSGSPAINAGATLGAPYNVDILGVSRPQGAAWDIGAYEIINEGIGGNNAPNQPSSPNPSNGANNQMVNSTLSWVGTDPNGDPLTYDVYFGTSSNLPLASSNQSNANFNPGQLNNSSTYYWKIVAKDNQGATTTGPVWSFSTLISDIIAPQLVSAQILDSITVVLEFSEQMNESSVENPNNYSITNGVNVINAVMTGNQVRLSTSEHINGNYQITVNNVTDIAGNLISPQANSQIYEFQSGSGLIQLPIHRVLASVISVPEYYPEKTIDGLGYYGGDPTSRWVGETMPEWLVYDLGDIQVINTSKLSFNYWDENRVYQYTLQISNDSLNWADVRTNISSFAQEWSIEYIGPIEARYIKIIFIANNQSAWAGLWEAEFYGNLKVPSNYDDDEKVIPIEYSLEQNYPNPFNPSTKISWQSPVASWQTLKVYDIIGNEVATLVDEFREAGRYEINFEASTEGQHLASGVYFYRLQSDPFVQTKKMILLR